MKSSLQAVFNRPDIWFGDRLARAEDSIASGFPELDGLLPGGGWPRGALTEVIVGREGIGELRLFIPALAKLTREERLIACVAPPYLPYAPALAKAGIKLSHFLLIRARIRQEELWAAEQVLRSGCISAVLFWLDTPKDLRRLQLAAEEGQSLGIIFRSRAQQSSYAALRLALTPAQDLTRLEILKRRGGQAPPLFLNLNVDMPLFSRAFPASSGETRAAYRRRR
ncbi:MAG TPA: translesion DNA synthesis-associated protein ImuA [Burkholderiales bacterium]|nr:translesion DNA synthesis-associated protein ImuA [Burkholderiales bacterium]